MDNKFIRLNTVFELPENVKEAIIDLSKEIVKNHEALFVLDGINFYPHITIYSPEYPESNFDKVLRAVEEIAKNTKRFEFIYEKKENHEGFIGVGFNLSPEIKNIHREIVNKLNSLREGRIRDKYKMSLDDYKMTFSSEQRENIEKYGYPDAMNLYRPHLTIIRLKNEILAKEVEQNLDWKISNFIVDKIAIYTMGEHGTCKEKLAIFNLI